MVSETALIFLSFNFFLNNWQGLCQNDVVKKSAPFVLGFFVFYKF
jgi:hypothetical protein